MTNVFCDGGARGNPGPAASAFVVEEDGKTVHKGAKFLGIATNNVAEYSAVILALSWIEKNLKKQNTSEVNLVLDSELVAKQMSGIFKIKNENLRKYFFTAKELEKKTGLKVNYQIVSREKNKPADFLVNKELDERE